MQQDDGNSKASRKHSWVRLWKDLPTDPKFRVIAKRAGRPLSEVVAVFVLMMTSADDDGALDWHADDAAAALDLEPEHVEAIHAAMQGKVLETNNLTGWRKRQPKREDCSTERVRSFRKRRETQCNAAETHGNAPDTDTEKIREETTSLPPEQVAAREEVKARKFDLSGVGLGSFEPSLEVRRAVARKLNIGDPTPILEAFREWPRQRSRNADAHFRAAAVTIFGNFTPEQRAACQPLAEPEPAIPKSTARPSPQLAALIANGARRHAH